MGAGLSVAEQQLVDDDDSALARLSGRRSLPPNHPFWTRLHEIRFAFDHLDREQVARVVDIVCSRMIKNNLESRNLNVLLALVCEKVGETVEGASVVPGITNLVFLARTFIQAFCENLTASELRQHLEAVFVDNSHALSIAILPDHKSSQSELPLPERLLSVLIDACLKIELTSDTTDFHIEILNMLLVLFSTQIYESGQESNLFLDLLFSRVHDQITPFSAQLLSYFLIRIPASAFSPAARPNAAKSWFSAISNSVVSMFLWPFQIYRVLFTKKEAKCLISDTAAFLILVLTHQGGSKSYFRTAFGEISDADNDFVEHKAGRVSFDRSFEALVQCLFQTQKRWAVLLLFTMMRCNAAFCEFVYSKSDVDVLVMPLLEMAYREERYDSNQMYTILVIFLILTNDDSFCDNAHRRLVISHVPWFVDFRLNDISLGSLIMAVLLRIMQKNQATFRDTYLHSNCLATLCNLAPHTSFIHEHTAQRLVSLLAALSRRYTRVANKVHQQVSSSLDLDNEQLVRKSSFCDDDASVETMATFGEFIRLLLNIISACLTTGNLADNMPLLYCLMHDQRVLEPFNHDPEFGSVAQHLWILVHEFINRLHLRALPEDCSVTSVQNVLRYESRNYKFSADWDIPPIQKFSYEDSGESENFFLPYSWEIVFRSASIPWSKKNIALFSLNKDEDPQSPKAFQAPGEQIDGFQVVVVKEQNPDAEDLV